MILRGLHVLITNDINFITNRVDRGMSEDKAKPDFVISVGGNPENETNPVGTNYLSETVYHKNAPLHEALLSQLERQKHKYWHFKFINDSDLDEFKNRIIKLDPTTITVEHNYGGQRHADIVIRKNGNIVGKLHFLHVNRPDICDPKKFYVKVHYYYFTDKELMNDVKKAVQAFFDHLDSSHHSMKIQKPISFEISQGGKRRHILRHTLRHTRRHKRHQSYHTRQSKRHNTLRKTLRKTLRHKN